MEFSELKDVPLREAWPHEANDFTPWLAGNLHRLSQAIGVDLELEDTEVSVEGFSADILARIPSDNSMVVIENQLENTDHTHLGQVLTYLAGLEAQTVIWIARDFQGPHLSAIRWLNSHTVDPFAFFAVKVRAVRIGDAPAPVAPLFEVIERPNDWDRQVKGAVNTSDKAARRQLNDDFWNFYFDCYPEDSQLRVNRSGSRVYYSIGDAVVYQYLAQDLVGVYLIQNDGSYDNEAAYLVARYKAALDRELSGRRMSLRIDCWNRDNWSEMADWLHERLAQFRCIIMDYEPGMDDVETTSDE